MNVIEIPPGQWIAVGEGAHADWAEFDCFINAWHFAYECAGWK